MKRRMTASAPRIPPTIGPVLLPFCAPPTLPGEPLLEGSPPEVANPSMNGSPAVAVPATKAVGNGLPLESVDVVSLSAGPSLEGSALPVPPMLDPLPPLLLLSLEDSESPPFESSWSPLEPLLEPFGVDPPVEEGVPLEAVGIGPAFP